MIVPFAFQVRASHWITPFGGTWFRFLGNLPRVKITYVAILQLSGTNFLLQRACPEIMKPNVTHLTFTEVSVGSLSDFSEFSLQSNDKIPLCLLDGASL